MKHLDRVRPNSILEVGCGLGSMAYRFASQVEYRGYEPDRSSFEVAASRLAELGRGEVVNAAPPLNADRQFDALCAFEVLEHIEDDDEALRAWTSWVRPEGAVILSVPAHPERFGACDVAVGHCRRYTRDDVASVMSAAGIRVTDIETWGMPAGYFLEFLRNSITREATSDQPAPDRTARSGRLYQPSGRLGRLTEAVMWPFAQVQKPFARTDYGIGFVAVGQVDH
jgi:SAM-dependent methyltransferase